MTEITPLEFVLTFPVHSISGGVFGPTISAMPSGPEDAIDREIGALRAKTAEYGSADSIGLYIRNKSRLEAITSYGAHEMERILHILRVFDDQRVHRGVTGQIESECAEALCVDETYEGYLRAELAHLGRQENPLSAVASFIGTAGPIVLCQAQFRVLLAEAFINVQSQLRRCGLVGETAKMMLHFDSLKIGFMRLLFRFGLYCTTDDQLKFALRVTLAMRRLSERSTIVDSLAQIERCYQRNNALPALSQAWRRLQMAFRRFGQDIVMADDDYRRPGVNVVASAVHFTGDAGQLQLI